MVLSRYAVGDLDLDFAFHSSSLSLRIGYTPILTECRKVSSAEQGSGMAEVAASMSRQLPGSLSE